MEYIYIFIMNNPYTTYSSGATGIGYCKFSLFSSAQFSSVHIHLSPLIWLYKDFMASLQELPVLRTQSSS